MYISSQMYRPLHEAACGQCRMRRGRPETNRQSPWGHSQQNVQEVLRWQAVQTGTSLTLARKYTCISVYRYCIHVFVFHMLFSSAVFQRKKVEVLSSLWCRHRRCCCRRCHCRCHCRQSSWQTFNLDYNFISVKKLCAFIDMQKWTVCWLQECQ